MLNEMQLKLRVLFLCFCNAGCIDLAFLAGFISHIFALDASLKDKKV